MVIGTFNSDASAYTRCISGPAAATCDLISPNPNSAVLRCGTQSIDGVGLRHVDTRESGKTSWGRGGHLLRAIFGGHLREEDRFRHSGAIHVDQVSIRIPRRCR